MNLITPVLVMALATIPVYGEPQSKKKPKSAIEKLFQSFKPKPAPTPRPSRGKKKTPVVKSEPNPTPPPQTGTTRSKEGNFIVDARWMAYYWEQELAWDYPIPEDADIKFLNGKYHVPPVVYRHYEDMVNAATSASR